MVLRQRMIFVIACGMVGLMAATACAGVRPKVGFVVDGGADSDNAAIRTLQAAMAAQSMDTVTLDGDLSANTLATFDILVLPSAATVTDDTRAALDRYARSAKPLVLIGPKPFSRPPMPTGKTKKDKNAPLIPFDEMWCAAMAYSSQQARHVTTAASVAPVLDVAIAAQVSPVFLLPRDGVSSADSLLWADTSAGPAILAAGLLTHESGPYRGSTWLSLGINIKDIAAVPQLTAWLAAQTLQLVSNPPASRPPIKRSLANVIGVTTMLGGYHFTQDDDLTEGAAKIHELGSRVIKLWFSQLPHAYPRTAWPEMHTLTDVAQSRAFAKVFSQDFDVYVLEAFSAGMPEAYWRNDATDAQFAEDEKQFYDLTAYLLNKYKGTGKTFVLQNWEGDWAVRGMETVKVDASDAAYDAMTRWINTRQRGVDRARREVGENGVHVLHAIEVNHVRSSVMAGKRNVIDRVVPQTNVDLVSYSCYDAQRDPRVFRACLEHIAAALKPKPGIEGNRVMIGEFGLPETAAGLDAVQRTLTNVVDVSLGFGCRYIIYWQLYCNEPVRTPVVHNDDTRGLWLIKPDGTKAWAWDFLSARLGGRRLDLSESATRLSEGE